jgi:hypothetical protein
MAHTRGNITSYEVEDFSEVKVWTVAVYDVDRQYGGPEEGGWWFDTGTLIRKAIVETYERACELREEWEEEFPYTQKRYSVLGGEDYNIDIIEGADVPGTFPEVYPHYE